MKTTANILTGFTLACALMFGLVNVASAMKHEAPLSKPTGGPHGPPAKGETPKGGAPEATKDEAIKGEAKMEQKMEEAVTKACKNKKVGDVVLIDGMKMKCPEKMNQEMKK